MFDEDDAFWLEEPERAAAVYDLCGVEGCDRPRMKGKDGRVASRMCPGHAMPHQRHGHSQAATAVKVADKVAVCVPGPLGPAALS